MARRAAGGEYLAGYPIEKSLSVDNVFVWAVILAFVGTKMLIVDLWHVPTWLSLVVIVVTLTVAVMTSLRAEARDEALARGSHDRE